MHNIFAEDGVDYFIKNNIDSLILNIRTAFYANPIDIKFSVFFLNAKQCYFMPFESPIVIYGTDKSYQPQIEMINNDLWLISDFFRTYIDDVLSHKSLKQHSYFTKSPYVFNEHGTVII